MELSELSAGYGKPCPHCGATELKNDDPEKTWQFGGETFGLLHCMACGGLFSHPLPSSAFLDALYKESFSYQWYQDHYPAKFVDSVHRVLQYRRMGILQGRILDYGGGLGYFSRVARMFGHDAITRDPMSDKKFDRAPGEGAGLFDTVVCQHTLEHDREPARLLEQVRGFMKPGANLIMAVPNAGGRGYRERGTSWVWSQPPFVHIHHFTSRGLRSLLEGAGFQITGEHFFERWDANTLADVVLGERFATWDAKWGTTRLKWLTAQLNSVKRFAALVATAVSQRAPAAERAELLMTATVA